MSDLTKFSAIRDGVRGNFTLNKMHTTTGDFFRWDVVHMVPCVQKDVMNINIHTFIDSGPNPYPINGSMKYGMYAFFIPYRLLWADWKNYITHLQSLTQPYFTLGDLWDCFHSESNPWATDYFDEAVRFISNIRNLSAVTKFLYYETKAEIPSSWLNLKFNGYALRAINRIWWDWMRDKAHISDSAIASYVTDTGGHMSVAELIQLCAPKYRCYPKNYITTAFEAPQEGGATVQPVRIADSVRNPSLVPSSGNYIIPEIGPTGNVLGAQTDAVTISTLGNPQNINLIQSGSTRHIGQFDFNDLRLNNSVQQFRERLIMLGKTIKSRAAGIFGVAPTIEELQMSNYLGGHEEDLYFKTSEAVATTSVAQTTGDYSPFGYNPAQANVAGQKYQNITTKDNNGFGLQNVSYKTDETGFLVIMGCITPVPQYFQGLPRDWFRGTDTVASDQFDYFHDDMENQPLQSVLNYEVCCDEMISPKGVFGFNQNYMDYKLEYDTIAGDYINPATSEIYKSMHLGRDIASLLSEIADPEAESWDEYLTPAILTQSNYEDRAIFDQKFTIPGLSVDHFRLNHKIEVLANRPMSEATLPSIDSALSRMTPKKKVETGGFRL